MRRTGESYATARAPLRRRGLAPSPAVEGDNLGADVAIRGLLQLLPEEGKEEPSGESATRPGYDQSLGELLDRAQDLETWRGRRPQALPTFCWP
jgi:hypothetical protein